MKLMLTKCDSEFFTLGKGVYVGQNPESVYFRVPLLWCRIKKRKTRKFFFFLPLCVDLQVNKKIIMKKGKVITLIHVFFNFLMFHPPQNRMSRWHHVKIS